MQVTALRTGNLRCRDRSQERGLLTGGPVTAPTVRSLLWALAILVVFAPLAVRAYRRKS